MNTIWFSSFPQKNLESEETLVLSLLLPRRKSFLGACSYTSLKDLASSLCPTANPDISGSLQDDRWNDPDRTIDFGLALVITLTNFVNSPLNIKLR